MPEDAREPHRHRAHVLSADAAHGEVVDGPVDLAQVDGAGVAKGAVHVMFMKRNRAPA